MTPLILNVRKKLEHALPPFNFNFCLLTRYVDGHDYIGPHSDHARHLVPHSPIVSVSFGATRRFHFVHKIHKTKLNFNLKHGECLVIEPPTNDTYRHSLPKDPTCHTTRISLTFRCLLQPPPPPPPPPTSKTSSNNSQNSAFHRANRRRRRHANDAEPSPQTHPKTNSNAISVRGRPL